MYINLLPWREKHRHQKKKLLAHLLLASSLISFLLSIILITYLNYQKQIVTRSNNILKQNINTLQKEYKQVSHLQKTKNILILRKKTLAKDRKSQSASINILIDIARLLPRSLKLIKISRINNKISLTGVSMSQQNISEFISKLKKQAITSNTIEVKRKKNHVYFQINLDNDYE